MMTRPANGLVFRYDYLPQIDAARLNPQDGGFSVELHHNNLLVISLYNRNLQPVQSFGYQMPTQMKLDYLALLDKNRDVLSAIETRLLLPEDRQPRYYSRIGLDQMELYHLHDMEQLIQLPFSDPVGHKGRIMYLFFEELAEKFLPYGLTLSPRMAIPHESLRGIPVMQPWHPYHTGSYYQTGAYQETGAYRQTGAHAPVQQDASNY